ncbi:MAG: dienelactone hydrolase family protein [Xanthobacteraceae bacterium]
MIEQTVDIPTKDGKTTTFIVHPDRGGPFPVILFYMDAPAIREELRDMARRLATSGYYVVLPNMYYRDGVMELGTLPADPDAPERKKMFQHMNNLTIPLVMDDTEALLKFIDGQSAASKGPMGAVGYCMSGQYAINAAARWPDRIVAAASIYGTRLITDEPHSPHLSAQKVSGEIYIGCAEHDSYVPQEMIAELQATIRDKNINAELEVYPGVHHGFAFPQRTIYDKAAAEKHWERLLSLYRRKLG